MPPWQNNAAMIHLDGHSSRRIFTQIRPFNQRASTGGAPVRLRGLGQHCMALAANSFHAKSLSHDGFLAP
jgi:predicted glycoside hydrolase/deacetylase ChbG (UPF0249 family)